VQIVNKRSMCVKSTGYYVKNLKSTALMIKR